MFFYSQQLVRCLNNNSNHHYKLFCIPPPSHCEHIIPNFTTVR